MPRRPAPSDGPSQLRWRTVDDDGGQASLLAGAERHKGRGELAGLELLHVRAGRVLNRVPAASRMPFRWTVNPYRGCSHACVYCFARPTHEFLGLGIGEDFERRIVVKVNAVAALRAELRAPSWAGEAVAMGTNTDPYQTAEGRYRLTQGIVAALTEARNPFSILTKSTLILRDTELLAQAAREVGATTALSIGCLDADVWRATEPHTPNPLRRMEAVAALSDAGVPCAVMIGPVIPGLSDAPDQLERVVRAAVAAGATSVTPILLHLRPGVREHWLEWLGRHHPELGDEYARRYRRAYATAEERRALAALVARMVAAAGGTRPHEGLSFRFRRRERAPAPAPDPQLRLI